MSKNRSKRLRKKLRLGEFQELGFEIIFSLNENIDNSVIHEFFHEFLTEAIEKNGLLFGGSSQGGFVTLDKRGSTSEQNRALVKNWLASQPILTNVIIGELVNAWY